MSLLFDEASFTKICIVGSGSADEAREEMDEIDEMLLERMMAVELEVLEVIVSACVVQSVRRACGGGRGSSESWRLKIRRVEVSTVGRGE